MIAVFLGFFKQLLAVSVMTSEVVITLKVTKIVGKNDTASYKKLN